MTGTQQTWGKITVFVPDGYDFNRGSFLNENDLSKCNITEVNGGLIPEMVFFILEDNLAGVEQLLQKFKEANSEDITLQVGDVTWTAQKYTEPLLSRTCGGGYANINGQYIYFGSHSFEFDNPIFLSILGSLQVNA